MTPLQHFHILVYAAYAAISVALTVFLARTLSKNGEVFLDEVFPDNARMASAVNQLLVVGFYLLNLGYAFLTLKAGHSLVSAVSAVELFASKLGGLLVSLGVFHFVNMLILYRIRRRGQLHLAPPPVAPQLHHQFGGLSARG